MDHPGRLAASVLDDWGRTPRKGKMEQAGASPEQVQELARACEQYVLTTLGFRLDYSVETLPVLDEYARQVRDTLELRPELRPLLAHAAGAYFGEVLCRTFGAFWRLPSSNVVDWQVCMRDVFAWLNPIGVAFDALAGPAGHSGPGSELRVAPEARELVRARLARLDDVEEPEYYLFSTRMEVIELAVEELDRHMQESGYADTSFEADDYEVEQRALL